MAGEGDNEGTFGKGLAVNLVEVVTGVRLVYDSCFSIFDNS